MDTVKQTIKKFIASIFQQALFDFLTKGTGNALVSAVAGSGKSTTLIKLLELIRPDKYAHFFAFNKHIVDELKDRIPDTHNVSISTLHSFGMKALGRIKKITLDDRKYDKLFEEMYIDMQDGVETKGDVKRRVMPLIQLSRVNLITIWEDMVIMSKKYNVTASDSDCQLAMSIIHAGARETDTIDFTDMIYLPVVNKIKVPMYDFVFVDECQDLSEAQRALMLMSVKPKTGRFIAVGDPHQSIYGFAGADVDSFNKFKEIPNTIELPLSVCYRCGSDILQLARTIVPHIQARDNAPTGAVNEGARIANVKSGDLILCRNTFPLVKLVFQFISLGIKANVLGRDIGMNLINMINKTKAHTFDRMFEVFRADLDKIESDLIRIKGIPKDEAKTDPSYTSYEDKIDAIRVVSEGCSTIQAMISKIDGIFSDKGDGIILSTIHKSKGLEADNVYIIHTELMPSKHAKLDWERTQERNLMYVAYTRAKNNLGFITDFDAYSKKGINVNKQTGSAPQASPVVSRTVGDIVSGEAIIKEVFEITSQFGTTSKYIMVMPDGTIMVKIGSMYNSKIISGSKLVAGTTVKIKAPVKSINLTNGEVTLGMLTQVE